MKYSNLEKYFLINFNLRVFTFYQFRYWINIIFILVNLNASWENLKNNFACAYADLNTFQIF